MDKKDNRKPRPLTKEELPGLFEEYFRILRTQGEEALTEVILRDIQERRNPVIQADSYDN